MTTSSLRVWRFGRQLAALGIGHRLGMVGFDHARRRRCNVSLCALIYPGPPPTIASVTMMAFRKPCHKATDQQIARPIPARLASLPMGGIQCADRGVTASFRASNLASWPASIEARDLWGLESVDRRM